MKETILENFNKLFPTKRLLAVHLNGFSHTAFYDSGNASSSIETITHTCAPEQNDVIGEKIFGNIPHYTYQNNAKEIIYVMPKNR